MSNAQVGTVYQQIIADVIESSRVDFEEGGVEENVLEELRQVWQQKLSSLKVATFPWDPKPEPAPAIANPPTVPSNAGSYAQSTPPPPPPPSTQAPPGMSQAPTMNNNANGTRIKTEPGMEGQPGMGQPPFQNPALTMPNATTAQQRAVQNLQNSYGPRAAASINAIQAGAAQQPQNPQQNMQHMQQQQHQAMQQQQLQQMQQQQQRAGQMPNQRPQLTPEQYRQAMAAQAAQAQQRLQAQNAHNQNGAHPPQTDGADDEMEDSNGLVKRFDANGEEVELGRVEIDGLIRQKIEAMGQKMEGGGLMLPLHQASTPSKRHRKVNKSASGAMPQQDGPGDDDDDVKGEHKGDLKDEEVDEDAINSDLDDPDDGLNDEEDEDEGMGHIMLCMYDKVQRVKNKWKCVMKDGVLTVNGKEYVFHKAQGEYEW